MIHVELVGGEEHGERTYTATAEFEGSVGSEDEAESRIQTLVKKSVPSSTPTPWIRPVG